MRSLRPRRTPVRAPDGMGQSPAVLTRVSAKRGTGGRDDLEQGAVASVSPAPGVALYAGTQMT